MRVNLLVALAIACVLLIFTAGTAMACSNPICGSGCTCGDTCACDGATPCCNSCGAASSVIPVTSVDGTKVADALQQQAFAATSADAFGFPMLDNVNAEAIETGLTDVDAVAANQINSVDACPCKALSDCGGDCGECPDCNCQETLTTIPGPVVNLACPTVNTVAVPVNLVSPVISPTFPTINLAPTATLALPQVNTQLNCFDINCFGCGCPTIDP